MRNRVSKRAKALQPSESVKTRVWRRDDGLCVWCKRPGLPEAHYIARNKLGRGVEENMLTLCRECHDKYDHGTREERERMKEYFRAYLSACYPGWDESKLYYRRY